MDSSDEDDQPLVKIKKKKKSPAKPDSAKSSSATKKKRKRESSAVPDEAPSSSSKKSKTNGSSSATKQLKKLEKTERLQYAMQAFLWWDAKEPPEGCQWVTMEHAGVSFPEDYVPHGVKMLYDGQPVDLTPAQEEA